MKKAISMITLLFVCVGASAQDVSLPRDFDFLNSRFDCTYTGYDAEGKAGPGYPCVWSGHYTFNGRMFQDDFVMFDLEGVEVFSGTTLRTWSPQLERWEMVFLGSNQAATWMPFHGTAIEGEIRISNSGEDQQGPFIGKIRFRNIGEQGFVWDLHRSYDDGASWAKSGEIVATKSATE